MTTVSLTVHLFADLPIRVGCPRIPTRLPMAWINCGSAVHVHVRSADLASALASALESVAERAPGKILYSAALDDDMSPAHTTVDLAGDDPVHTVSDRPTPFVCIGPVIITACDSTTTWRMASALREAAELIRAHVPPGGAS